MQLAMLYIYNFQLIVPVYRNLECTLYITDMVLAEKYISCYFKEHFHITLSQYVNHLRLEHARQLLEESATSVTEVAMCSGYQNVSYFICSICVFCVFP